MLAVEIPALKSFSVLLYSLFSPQFLRSSTQITWGALFRHEVLSRDPLLLAMIPKYLRASMTNLVKVCGNCGQIGVRRCLGGHGLWVVGEKLHFYCVCERGDSRPLSRQLISTCYCLLHPFSFHLLEAGVSCDEWLLFLPDLVCSVSRWAFPLKRTAPVVNTPALILTVMRTSMPSSTVSCHHPAWKLLSVPFLLLSAGGWAWSPPYWLGNCYLCLDSFILDLGVKVT